VDAIKDAIGQGARIIEAHFTFNRAWKGTDQAFSMEPKGLAEVCEYMKRYFVRLGSVNKVIDMQEKTGFVKKMGKSIYLSHGMKKGEVIRQQDIVFKAPAVGLLPSRADFVVGHRLINDCSTGIALTGEEYE
jgi:N-acetylneuraminate synthase/sialic acid synthase